MTVQLFLFGPPSIHDGERAIPLTCERRTQLLVHLALRDGWVGRDELAALLWPEQDTRLAQANLRKTLHRLAGVAGAERLQAQGRALRVDIATDVQAFDAALREARIAEAIALRRGDLLAGFDDDRNAAWTEWLAHERGRLRTAWRTALLQHLGSELPIDEGMQSSLVLLQADPLDEAAVRMAMHWHARAGQLPQVRALYREFSDRLGNELALAPSAELKALYDELTAAGKHSATRPALNETPAAGRARFIGRAVELRRLAALLSDPACRLLTILGPGGMGKTRLAQQAAQALAPQYADGAVFIALDDVTAAADFVQRLAHELNAKLAGQADPLAAVAAVLAPRQTLLVLDNFEQLLEAAPMLQALLQQCPRLSCIVTSRVRLGLPAEWLFVLDGLPWPDIEDLQHLESFDAVQLFLQAARRVAPPLMLLTDAPAIIEICQQVEGLPLALELAAAWTRVLSCAEIAAELKRGGGLLQAADAAQPARHGSIEAVINQSWLLLTEVERHTLAALAIFRGGCTADAARDVTRAPLAVLAALADRSLLRREGGRLSLHPLVQQFAAARLTKMTRTAARASHATYFLGLLHRSSKAISGADRATLVAFEADFDNCRAAWTWAINGTEGDLARRAAKPLLDICEARSRHGEALELFRRAVTSPLAQMQPAFRALVRAQAAQALYRLDRYDEARAEARLALADSGSEPAARRQAHNVLGTCALRQGLLDEARVNFEHVLANTPPETHAQAVAQTLDHLALIEKGLGHLERARELGLQALAQHRLLGHRGAEALCLSNLGSINIARQDFAGAEHHLREALALCEREQLTSTQQFVLVNLAEVLRARGDLSAAASFADKALAAASAVNHRALVCQAHCQRAHIAAAQGDFERAAAAVGSAAAVVVQLDMRVMKLAVLASFADLLHHRGLTAGARQVLRFATTLPGNTPGDQAELQELLDALPAAPERDWPDIDLAQLLQRLGAEAPLAHAPLIAALRD